MLAWAQFISMGIFFAVVAVVMFALYANPTTTQDEDLIAQVEQADLLVMLEENLY